MIYHVTERLIVDDEVGFACDINRAVELINAHRNVAVGTFFEAIEVLRDLGLTDASIRILIERATAGKVQMTSEVVAELGWGEQDAISR